MRKLKLLDLFSGIGGFTLAAEILGFETVAFCEIDRFPQSVLKYRYPNIPIIDDIRNLTKETFKSTTGLDYVDIICGGSPCTSMSIAGKREGFKGESGIFYEYARVLSTVLLVTLVFTYSRSGILVATLEAIFFVLFYGKKYWKIFVGLGIGLLIVLFVSGGFGRLTFDTSASNRLLIWANGLYIFLANPLGVGLGNSGEITSAFLLLDDINCRTLINSHFTLLCEFGCIIGTVWFAIIFTAIKNGIFVQKSKLKFATLNSFCGLLISSSLSTVFDWEVLLNPSQFTHLTGVNLVCSYLLFGVFCLLAVYLLFVDFRIKIFLISFIVCLALGFIILAVSYKIPLKVRVYDNATFVQDCKSPQYSVVLFDDDYTLKSALQILKKLKLDDKILIATKSWQYKETLPRLSPKNWILFGKCADFASSNPTSPIILIKPSPYYNINKSTPLSQIYLPMWDPKYNRLKKEFQNWKEL